MWVGCSAPVGISTDPRRQRRVADRGAGRCDSAKREALARSGSDVGTEGVELWILGCVWMGDEDGPETSSALVEPTCDHMVITSVTSFGCDRWSFMTKTSRRAAPSTRRRERSDRSSHVRSSTVGGRKGAASALGHPGARPRARATLATATSSSSSRRRTLSTSSVESRRSCQASREPPTMTTTCCWSPGSRRPATSASSERMPSPRSGRPTVTRCHATDRLQGYGCVAQHAGAAWPPRGWVSCGSSLGSPMSRSGEGCASSGPREGACSGKRPRWSMKDRSRVQSGWSCPARSFDQARLSDASMGPCSTRCLPSSRSSPVALDSLRRVPVVGSMWPRSMRQMAVERRRSEPPMRAARGRPRRAPRASKRSVVHACWHAR